MQEELIQEFLNGNKQAGDDFYNANIGLVYLTTKKYKRENMDFEETLAIVNQAFAYTMEKFDTTKAEFSTYFMATARGFIGNHCRDLNSIIRTKRSDFRKNKTIVFCDSLDRMVHHDEGAEIFLKDVRGEEDDYSQVIVDEALKKLNKIDRDAFSLHLSRGISQRQIGEMLCISQVQVSRRIARAIATLKVILKDAC